jgi:hypothetical protein
MSLSHPLLPLAEEMLDILRQIDADAEAGNNGEVSPELEERLQAIESRLPDHIDDLAEIIRALHAYSEECNQEAKRLSARGRSWENKAVWLKGRILSTMLAIGEQKIKTARNTVSVCKNGGLLPLQLPERVELIPDDYVTSRTIIEPDKEKIRKELEAGKELEFARLGERGVHLKIS